MTTFNKKNNTVRFRLAVLASSVLAAIPSAVLAEASAPEPVYTTAAFSQLNSGTSPPRVFVTDLNVFALDSSAKQITIWRKTATGTQLRQFAGVADVADGTGAKGFTFASPWGLAKHPTANILAVADRGVSAQRIVFYAYSESATEVTFTYLGAFSDSSLMPYPKDVAFFPDGDVAVCGNISSGLGAYVRRLTGGYGAMTSAGLIFSATVGTVDGLDVDPVSGNVFIASASHHCVYEYAGATHVRTYGISGVSGTAEGRLNSPMDVAVWRPASLDAKLLVADTLNDRMVIFNTVDGNSVLMQFGQNGSWPGQFNKPGSAHAGGLLAVADTSNGRIQLFDFDVSNIDSDRDGIPDWWEIEHGLDLYDPADALLDPDGDGLTNLREYGLGTDPHNPDTDGDGLSDGFEYLHLETDPLDPNDPGADALRVLGDPEYPESVTVTQTMTVVLGSVPSNEVVFSITGYLPGAVEGPPTLTFPAGVNMAEFAFQALNGNTNAVLTFTQTPAGSYLSTHATFSVMNVAPTILSASASAETVNVGEALIFTGVATDPSHDVLTYVWTFSDGSTTLSGATVTNTLSTPGEVTVTLTVSDPDGGSDSTQLTITVNEGEPSESVTPVFTAITMDQVSFKIPTAFKTNDFLVSFSTELTPDPDGWTDWLLLPAADLAAGGAFSVNMLISPASPVAVSAIDGGDDFTTVTFGIDGLLADYLTVFFRVMFTDDSP